MAGSYRRRASGIPVGGARAGEGRGAGRDPKDREVRLVMIFAAKWWTAWGLLAGLIAAFHS